MNLSAVILTKNEEANIEACIQSIRFADEIVVIDDYSDDKTTEIAERYGVKVFKRHLGDDFAKQRNYGLDKALGKWALFVDADERITAKLKEEIIEKTKSSNKTGYYLTRRDHFFGKILKYGEFCVYGPFGNQKLLRLANKGAGKWIRAVHEHWEIRGNIGLLKFPLLHFPHQTIKEFVDHINYFSTIHAGEIIREKKQPSLLKVILWPIFKFIYNSVFRLGLLDGQEGFIAIMMMSFHSFLAWSKVWVIKNQN